MFGLFFVVVVVASGLKETADMTRTLNSTAGAARSGRARRGGHGIVVGCVRVTAVGTSPTQIDGHYTQYLLLGTTYTVIFRDFQGSVSWKLSSKFFPFINTL